MSLWDKEIVNVTHTASQKAEKAANDVVKISRQLVRHINSAVASMRNIVSDGGGKGAVAGKLTTNEATELQNLYNDAKAFVETYSDKTVVDL